MVKKELAKTYREFSEKPLEYLLKALVSRVSTAVAGLLSALRSLLLSYFLIVCGGWDGLAHHTCGLLNGFDNVVVPRATAKVARKSLADFVLGWVWVVL
jgi:hypothetical protein